MDSLSENEACLSVCLMPYLYLIFVVGLKHKVEKRGPKTCREARFTPIISNNKAVLEDFDRFEQKVSWKKHQP